MKDDQLLPFYEYFAESIEDNDEIQSFKTINFNLPSSPWLKDRIIPVLELNSNRLDEFDELDLENSLTTLELSNCSLSADDLSALATFLAGNKTLRILNLSKNNIESVDNVKSLAKAIKKHPLLRSVNLSQCSIGGGDSDALDKLLVACKECDSLEIGHSDFTSEGVAVVAKFLSRKMSLASFSLVSLVVPLSTSMRLYIF